MKAEFLKYNAGIDISKDDFKVFLMGLTISHEMVVLGNSSMFNTIKGFDALLKWVFGQIPENAGLTFTMEATGVYYEALAYYLFHGGYQVSVVLPNHSKKYAESLGSRTKTDATDARILARMGLERELRRWQPFSPLLLQLKQLTRERDALIREITQAKNQLHAYSHQGVVNSGSIARTQEKIGVLDRQVKAIGKEIENIVNGDQALKERIDKVISIPGVGLLTAVCIVSETNGFAGIGNLKQLTGFAGLDVRIIESGLWKGKSRISKKGNSHIRKALYFPAFTFIRLNEQMQQHYCRLKAKKGKPMIAVVAIQRKLLCLIYTLWKKNEMFCADYEKCNKKEAA